MANSRADFADEVRNKAWFSSDTRMALDGKATTVILQKQGKAEREDLSGVEVVQMGHVMEPFIAKIAEDKLGFLLAKADWTGTHPSEPWMQSHFDYVKEVKGGYIPYEIKNYNITGQLIQEAICLNADRAVLCVLFGGQHFRHYELTVTDEMKEELTKQMAIFWGHVVANTLPDPQTLAECKLVYTNPNDSTITATYDVERAVGYLKDVKNTIKELEAREEQLAVVIQNHLKNGSELVSVSGEVLATWKQSKASKRFSADLFKSAMPDIYEKFVVEQSGSRRFLVK
jgi:hypothetical protein